jgi:hypothetical protein
VLLLYLGVSSLQARLKAAQVKVCSPGWGVVEAPSHVLNVPGFRHCTVWCC